MSQLAKDPRLARAGVAHDADAAETHGLLDDASPDKRSKPIEFRPPANERARKNVTLPCLVGLQGELQATARVDGVDEGIRTRESRRRGRIGQAQHDGVEPRRHPVVHRQVHTTSGIGLQARRGRGAGHPTVEKAVQGDAERIEVGSPVDGRTALQQFRRDESWRAAQIEPANGLDQLGDAEIQQFGGAVGRHHDVRRLHVEVDDPAAVNERQRPAHGHDRYEHVTPARAADRGFEIDAVDVLHREEAEAGFVLRIEVVDGSEIGVGQLRQQTELRTEAA